jgi:hypothetical protein
VGALTVGTVVIELVVIRVLRLQELNEDLVLDQQRERVGVPVVHKAVDLDVLGAGWREVHLEVRTHEKPVVGGEVARLARAHQPLLARHLWQAMGKVATHLRGLMNHTRRNVADAIHAAPEEDSDPKRVVLARHDAVDQIRVHP